MDSSRLGIWALLALCFLCACGGAEDAPPPEAASPRPNLLLIVLDTVRADRLGAYGYGRARTPHLDAFARQSVLYENCMSSSCWTLPSHASLFTGLLPIAHQATQETLRLAADYPTLAELLTDAGYAAYGASANAVVGPANGLDRGFAHFEELYRTEVEAEHRVAGRHPHDVALQKWIGQLGEGRPFFAFLNYIEAHTPYRPPEPFLSQALAPEWTQVEGVAASREKTRDHWLRPEGLPGETIEIMSRLYDGEIAFLDWAFGRLLQMLEAQGLLDETLIVVTSDHGEHFGEHGLVSHSFSLYEGLVRVPLLVRQPGGIHAGTRRTDPVHLMDLFPSLLGAAGVETPRPSHGEDVFKAAVDPQRIRIAEYYYPRQMFSMLDADLVAANLDRLAPYMQRLRAVRRGDRKLIWSSDGRHELYDLAADPRETSSLFAQESGALWDFNASYADEFSEGADPGPVPPKGWTGGGFEEHTDDPELLERLRALGYVN